MRKPDKPISDEDIRTYDGLVRALWPVQEQPLQTAGGFPTREEWLDTAVVQLRAYFAERGVIVPDSLRISCGWPLRRSRSGRSDAISECWARRASDDGACEIFVSPELADPYTVTSVLAHQLVHAADDWCHGHRGPFRRMALAVGLRGPMRSTRPGPELRERLNALCSAVGSYPHARLDPMRAFKRQSTRLIKIVCDRPGHNYSVWTTRMWLDSGTPICPCGSSMSEIARRI
jgi:hypothetical protein